MTGLYLYKAISQYPEDVTKDCKLTINELDSNFLNLKDMDIKDVEFDATTSVISLVRNNGEVLDADLSALSNILTVEYDSKKGEIVIEYDGVKSVIDKLVTVDNLNEETLTEVISDSSLIGLGSKKKPLGISPVHQTGSYKPAFKMFNILEGEHLPRPDKLKKGDRYVTKESVSEYGRLYNYDAVKKINSELTRGWRVPTKADWDNMLNAIEPCEYRNHEEAAANKVYGKLAGKLLKAKTLWTVAYNDEEVCSNCEIPSEVTVEDTDYIDNGERVIARPKTKKISPNGVDSFGMRLVPAGFHDDCMVEAYFHSRGYYWTTSQISETDIYVKRFDFNRSGVIQTLASPKEYYSIRLVKDYDGHNFEEIENIDGHNYPCVLVPSLNTPHGFSIWTVENLNFTNPNYGGLEPNNGLIDEQTTVTVYYVNEWNGFKWERKQIKEGEQIVLFEGLDGDKNIEYMVVDGELISSAKIIEDKVKAEIQKEIDALDDRLSWVEEDLGHATEYEYEYETDENGDLIFDEDGNPIIKTDEDGNPIIKTDEDGNPIIKEPATGLHADVEANAKAIEDEVTRAQEAEEKLQEAIDAVEENVGLSEDGEYVPNEEGNYIADAITVVDSINKLDEALKNEEETRIEEDAKLQAEIDKVEESVGLSEDGEYVPNEEGNYISDAETVVDSINELDKALKNEEDERKLADELLQAELDETQKGAGLEEDGTYTPMEDANYVADAKDLKEGIKKLDEALKVEETDRINMDNYLHSRLVKIEQPDNAFNCAGENETNEGVLTLHTEDPANNIVIKLSGDFGEIPFKNYGEDIHFYE